MNLPSTGINFQRQTQIHINPHMIQNHNPHQALPIITRPISTSPTHLIQPKPIQNSSLKNSNSCYQMKPIHQSRQIINPCRPQNVTQMQHIKRNSVSPISKSNTLSHIQYLSIEGVYHPQPFNVKSRNQSPRITINPLQHQAQIEKSQIINLHKSSRTPSHYQSVKSQITYKAQCQRNPKINQLKKAYINEKQQINHQLPQIYVDKPIEKTQSQTVFHGKPLQKQENKKQVKESIESNIIESRDLKDYVKSVNEKGQVSYVKVFSSMDQYLKKKNQTSREKVKKLKQVNRVEFRNPIRIESSIKNSNDYMISFNENGDIKNMQQKQHVSSINSRNNNRSHLSNLSHHQSRNQKDSQSQLKQNTNKNSNYSCQTPFEKNKLSQQSPPDESVNKQKSNQNQLQQNQKQQINMRIQKSSQQIQQVLNQKQENKQRESKLIFQKKESRQIKAKVQPITTPNYIYHQYYTNYNKNNQSRNSRSNKQLNKYVEVIDREESSSVSGANVEEIQSINIRFLIQQIYGQQLENGLRKINQVYNRSLDRIQRV